MYLKVLIFFGLPATNIVLMAGRSARQTISRLHAIRNCYGSDAADEKRRLLEALQTLETRSAADLRRLHSTLCFLRAFPDSDSVHTLAGRELRGLAARISNLRTQQRTRLDDSGIAGTVLYYAFSCEVAAWMARRFPGVAAIDWDSIDDTSRLDELLAHLLHHTESDYFDSGHVSTGEWLGIAAQNAEGTDFDWLMAELRDRRRDGRFWTSMYNAAEIPLRCKLDDSALSKTFNEYGSGAARTRVEPMENRVRRAGQEIATPLRSMQLLAKKDGERLLDVAMASLAVRHRETIHFNTANPAEVWLADVGKGVKVAATGLLPEHRYPLECTMGFLILSNGMPIGYGGSSMFYRQANNGINIFDEFRGSEAAWLWVQVMRVFHALSGCNRFIANPYQFGEDNEEALKSGAFWFYYRLGYRPVDAAIRKLARNEYAKVAAGRRTPLAMLRQLATCDMHLTLPDARQADYFDEGWIEFASLLATRELAKTGLPSRRRATDAIAHQLASDLGLESLDGWSGEERRWFVRLAPIVAATHPVAWAKRDRDALVRMMRAKGGDHERDYIHRFGGHRRFFTALKKACRRVADEH